MSALVFASFFIHAEAFAQQNVESFDFNGAWQLERTENFDEYLKASGTSWWKRKLAQLGSSSMRQTIKHEGIRFEVESENPVEKRSEVFIADGKTELSAETASGDMMTWIARIEKNTLVVDGHGDLGHRIIVRENVGPMMVVTVVNPDAKTECKLFFEQVEAE